MLVDDISLTVNITKNIYYKSCTSKWRASNKNNFKYIQRESQKSYGIIYDFFKWNAQCIFTFFVSMRNTDLGPITRRYAIVWLR